MKIFLDSANLEKIKELSATGLIDGITTNPSNLSKVSTDPKKTILEICNFLKDGEISVEVTEIDPESVYKQAKRISDLAENVIVKIPCHKDYYPIINRLVKDEIKLNITLVFTLMQALFMSKLGVKYISPFVGRWDDIDCEGVDLLHDIRFMIDQYGFETQILSASIRDLRHFHKTITAGADVITVPDAVFEKSLHHILTDEGIKKFDSDWKKLGIKIFP